MRRFRFWMSYTNSREKNYGASLTWGNAVHVRGWDAGIKVTPRIRHETDVSETAYTDADEFDVSMTWGSHGGDRSVLLGTVRDTVSGPVWIPEPDLPADHVPVNLANAIPRPRQHRRRRTYVAPATGQSITTGQAAEAERGNPDIQNGLPAGHRMTEEPPAPEADHRGTDSFGFPFQRPE